MCLGVPMQVLESNGFVALCADDSGVSAVDVSLVGEVSEGEWLLVFTGAARGRLSEARALDIRDALSALTAALNGDFDPNAHFQDLINREPSLPPHLQALVKKEA